MRLMEESIKSRQALLVIGILLLLGIPLANSSHAMGTYKLLASGKYVLDLKHGMYWIWLFPKWSSLALLEGRSYPAASVIVRDKNGANQAFSFIGEPGKYKEQYSDGSKFVYKDSKRHGYTLAWFFVKADGKYTVEYKTDRPCLLMFAPASAVHRNLNAYNVIDGISDDRLETPVVR